MLTQEDENIVQDLRNVGTSTCTQLADHIVQLRDECASDVGAIRRRLEALAADFPETFARWPPPGSVTAEGHDAWVVEHIESARRMAHVLLASARKGNPI